MIERIHSQPLLIYSMFLCSTFLFGQATNKQAPVQTQGYGYKITYDRSCFTGCKVIKENGLTIQEVGSGIPEGVGPSRVAFLLKSIVPKQVKDNMCWVDIGPMIRIFHVEDINDPGFRRAYPYFYSNWHALRNMIKSGSIQPMVSKALPYWDQEDCIQTIHAKPQVIETPWCKGIQYLTVCIQEAVQIDSDRLEYRFEGISKDGKNYISLGIPIAISIPSLPAEGIADWPQRQADSYYDKVEKRLDPASSHSFFPDIELIHDLVYSVGTETGL